MYSVNEQGIRYQVFCELVRRNPQTQIDTVLADMEKIVAAITGKPSKKKGK